jgi:outer membrane receptor protein involved in Fe transport
MVDELVAGFGQTEPSSSEFAFVPSRRSFAHFQHEHVSARDIDWKVDLAWQRIDDDRRTRDFGAAATRFEDNRSDLYGLSINASGSRAGLDWIAGLDLYHDEVRSARRELDTLTGVTSDLAPRFPDGSIVDQGGAFARIDWQSGERHRLSLGIRYTDVRIELPDGTRIDPDSPSGDLGWIFNLNEELQIVANAGSGFRAPNIADLGTLGNRPGNRFNVPNADLDAESVTHFDVGLRLRRPDWRAVLIAYRLDYDERIISVDTGSKTPEGRDIVRSVNAAESTVHGVEAGLDARIAERVNLVATLNYTYGVQRVADSEEPADRVPPLRARVLGSFRHSDSWVYEAWLDAARGQDRLSDRDIRDVRIDPQGTPGWATLGVRARWTLQQGWQLVGAVDNILDRRYRVHGSGLDAPGRNLSLTIQRSW